MQTLVYKGQDYNVELTANIDLSAFSTLKIRYQKPDTETGEVTATAGGSGNTVATGTITDAINDTVGSWLFQLYAVAGTGEIYFGSTVKIECRESIAI